MPMPTILPSSRTMILSASRMVPMRWATMSLVDPLASLASASRTSRSVLKSSAENESSKIRIRGINTIQGDAEPLWVVDGVPLQDDLPEIDTDQIKSGNLNQIFVNGVAGINPSDIENVTILKDAAADLWFTGCRRCDRGHDETRTSREDEGELFDEFNDGVKTATGC